MEAVGRKIPGESSFVGELRLRRKTFGGSRFSSFGFEIAIPGLSRRHERRDQRSRRVGDLFNRSIERRLIRFGGGVESAELADELKGRRADFLFRRRRIEVEQRLDVSAHACRSECGARRFSLPLSR